MANETKKKKRQRRESPVQKRVSWKYAEEDKYVKGQRTEEMNRGGWSYR